MKVSDYIVSFLIEKGITDVFGYPGGMVTYLMDSLSMQSGKIRAHVCYHEQGASFAACGYAQISLRLGVSYATSGPGVTNLATGIANSYFDSCPTMFITGQVNTNEEKGCLLVRQRGFQEMDVVAFATSITKYCVKIDNADDIRYHLEKAHALATSGRPGPVVLDIPIDIQRTEIEPDSLRAFEGLPSCSHCSALSVKEVIYNALKTAERPCIIVGAGVNSSGMGQLFSKWVENIKVPVVCSMLAVDALPNSLYNYGFIGAYGLRHANFILAKSDLIISLGSRLDLRQTGAEKKNFAKNAKLIRIDIDSNELAYKIKEDEQGFQIDLKELLPVLSDDISPTRDFSKWINVCKEIYCKLKYMDDQEANLVVRKLSNWIDPDAVITTDVGQNQVWVAQSFVSKGQRVLFSGGHGSMGYSLPAAIGAYYGSGGKKVISFNGDGGIQMNIQELQFIAREQIPVKIILLNNNALGMIRHFQEMYFESNYVHTKEYGGYVVPDFAAISTAYNIPYIRVQGVEALDTIRPYLENSDPAFVEITLEDDTYVYPKLAMGKLNEDQEPLLDRETFNYISNL